MVVAAKFGEQDFAFERFYALGERAGSGGWGGSPLRVGGKAMFTSSAVMVSLFESSRTRSTTFRNSRTLPGHG